MEGKRKSKIQNTQILHESLCHLKKKVIKSITNIKNREACSERTRQEVFSKRELLTTKTGLSINSPHKNSDGRNLSGKAHWDPLLEPPFHEAVYNRGIRWGANASDSSLDLRILKNKLLKQSTRHSNCLYRNGRHEKVFL